MHICKARLRDVRAVQFKIVTVMIFTVAVILAVGFISYTRQVQASTKEGIICDKLTGAVAEKGWLDENTYQCTACGLPSKNTPKEKIKKDACRAAVLNCQYTIIQDLRAKYDKRLMELYGDTNYLMMTGFPSFHEEMKRIVKSGLVVSEEFEDPVCAVTMRVSKKGLRQWSDDLAKELDVK